MISISLDKYEILVTHPVTRKSEETKYGYLELSMSRFLWTPPPHTRRNAGDISFLTCPLLDITASYRIFSRTRAMSRRFVRSLREFESFYSPTRGTCAECPNRFSRWPMIIDISKRNVWLGRGVNFNWYIYFWGYIKSYSRCYNSMKIRLAEI